MTEANPTQHEATKNISGQWRWYCTRCGAEKTHQGAACDRCDSPRHDGIFRSSTGWWLFTHPNGKREAIPHHAGVLSSAMDGKISGSTYIVADVIKFIMVGTLPCQLTGSDDHANLWTRLRRLFADAWDGGFDESELARKMVPELRPGLPLFFNHDPKTARPIIFTGMNTASGLNFTDYLIDRMETPQKYRDACTWWAKYGNQL
jgi:hypothetical protein